MTTGPELMDGIIADTNSLDRLLDRDPKAKPYTDGELLQLVQEERARRTAWEIKQEKKKNKKQGIEEQEE